MYPRISLFAIATALMALHPVSSSAAVTTSGCGGSPDTCTLSQLFGGGEFTANGLRFSDFALLADVGSNTLSPSTITLTGLDDGTLSPGFRFNGNGQLATAPGDDIGYVFQFRVNSLDGLPSITGANLVAGTGTVGTDDEWRVQARTPADNFLPGLEIVDSTLLSETNVTDSFTFPASGSITVSHLILLDSSLGLSPTGAALDDYTMQLTVVPVPAALPLMLSALGILAFFGRSKDRQ